jgi:hypothetical protein
MPCAAIAVGTCSKDTKDWVFTTGGFASAIANNICVVKTGLIRFIDASSANSAFSSDWFVSSSEFSLESTAI